MSEKTGIAWTTSTFNPWIGCTRVSPGCDHCYAEALDRRYQYGRQRIQGQPLPPVAPHWGAGAPRHKTSEGIWRAPHKWNKAREEAMRAFDAGRALRPEPHRVFCASLADVFDNEVPEAWRTALWDTILSTPYLTWQVLTKRIGNVARMIPHEWNANRMPRNLWLGSSVVNQEEADRDIPKLLQSPAVTVFISYEPALGPVDFHWYLPGAYHADSPGLDWIIIGGESAQGGAAARPFDLVWARAVVEQCRAARVACFVKQLGSNVVTDRAYYGASALRSKFKDSSGSDPEEWPEDLRVQQFPDSDARS